MNRKVEDETATRAAASETCGVGALHETYLLAYDGVVTGGPNKGPFAGAEVHCRRNVMSPIRGFPRSPPGLRGSRGAERALLSAVP